MSSSMRCACARKPGQSAGSSVSRCAAGQRFSSGALSRYEPLSMQNVSVAENTPSCRLLSAEYAENFKGRLADTLQSNLETGDHRVRQRGARAGAVAAREAQFLCLCETGDHRISADQQGGAVSLGGSSDLADRPSAPKAILASEVRDPAKHLVPPVPWPGHHRLPAPG